MREGAASASPLRFKAYRAYKDSGVEWLGGIPAHWAAKRARHLVTRIEQGWSPQCENRQAGDDEWGVLKAGCVNRGVFVESEHKALPGTIDPSPELEVHEGDLLMSRASGSHDLVGSVALVPRCRPRLLLCDKLFRLHVGTDGGHRQFLAYAMNSPGARWQIEVALSGGSGLASNIAQGDVKGLILPEPPREEQRAIAGFLDRETARIDALVAKKERLIELLQEERAALITRAVTKGLDPEVPIKDSEVAWLGAIPAHWVVKRLWYLTPSARRIMYGIVLPGPNVPNGIPIVKGGDVSPDHLRLDRLNRTTAEIEAAYVRSRLRAGDLVFAIRGSIGEVAIVPDELEGANLTQDAARISYTAETHGPWLLHALRSAPVFAQLEAGALGATIRGINIRDLKRASIAVPPLAEQRAIAEFLVRETARIDALIAKIREAIERLQELRTALISAAVTGKIDVREAVA